MGVGTTPLGAGWRAGSVAWWPLFAEAALVAAVVFALLPFFAPLSTQDTGRDARFATPVVTVRGLPEPVLPQLCAAYGARAGDAVRARLCGHAEASPREARLDRVPLAVSVAVSRTQQAFLASIEQARARVAPLRQQQREGAGDDIEVKRALDEALAEISPSLRRHALDGDGAAATRSLTCAAELLRDAFAAGSKANAARETALANAVLVFGAALDSHPGAAAMVERAALPDAKAKSAACAGLDLRASLAASSALVADARHVRVTAAKDDAMRLLLATARWQWAAWAVLGLVLLELQRSGMNPVAGVGIALAAWAAVAWACRVPWPLGSAHAFELGRASLPLTSMPAGFVVAMLAASALLLALAPWLRHAALAAPSTPASIFGYPGLVAATGIGWLLLLDLSANGNFGNRYLALYHQGHLWLGMVVFTIMGFLRQAIGRGIAWLLALVDAIAARIAKTVGAFGAASLLLPLALLVTAALAALLANTRQLTSELGRLWLVIGAAWFFFMRGTPLTERLARSGNSLGSLVRYTWPLVFVVIVLVAAMFLTHDMGPLLIAGYAAGAFIAASVAMWLYQRSGARASAYALAVLLFAAWIAVTTVALFRLGAVDQVTAERLENAGAPFVSANDQLALVTWFRRAAPASGFGPGSVPWCGFGASSACAGVPAQIQSDYTFTALVGMFGWTLAWTITLGTALWLYTTVRPHGRASRGEPRLLRVGGRIRNDEQAFVSWICVAWLVLALCQLAVTVAGNLAVIPLTGVTFPFVSFGMTSLVINMAMLALAIDVAVTKVGQ